jgi:hypothetical protein
MNIDLDFSPIPTGAVIVIAAVVVVVVAVTAVMLSGEASEIVERCVMPGDPGCCYCNPANGVSVALNSVCEMDDRCTGGADPGGFAQWT